MDEKEVRVDTIVQEKNITFPTDRKLIEKLIEHCKGISRKEEIKIARTYGREIEKLKHQFRFSRKPENLQEHKKAQRRLHRIAFRIYQDPLKQLNPVPKSYMGEVDVWYRILTKQRDYTNKICSIHEPEMLCISKGKNLNNTSFGTRAHLPLPGNQG